LSDAPIRKFGSAALGLAYVAAGRFDAYWEWELNYWDVAAGHGNFKRSWWIY
jgi:myo-inositol-1(or 4)-monophosphatase